MFKLDLSPGFQWPVTFKLLSEQGVAEAREFKAIFHRLPKNRIAELVADAQTGAVNDRQLAEQVLRGWLDVFDADDLPLAFNAENMGRLLDVYPVERAVVEAWFDSVRQGEEKN